MKHNERQKRTELTQALIEKLGIKNHRYYLCDSDCIGLRIYVQTTGHKSFHMQRYIPKIGNRRTKLGGFPQMSIMEARKLASKMKAKSVLGEDPLLAKKENENEKTFGQVVEEYMELRFKPTSVQHAKSTIRKDRYNYTAWFLGKAKDSKLAKFWNENKTILNIASKRLSIISEEDVLQFHEIASVRGKYGANRLVAAIRKLFYWAAKRGHYSGKNPASWEKKQFNQEFEDHLDFYNSKDMEKIIAATEKLSKNRRFRVPCFGILAALFCGGRPMDEVFNISWDMVKWGRKVIQYPKTKTGGGDRPITDTMLAHLQKIKTERENKGTASPFYYPPVDPRHNYIFPNYMFGKNKRTKRGVKKCKLKHIKDVDVVWRKIKKLAGVENKDLKSLRHTFATYCVTLGIPLRLIQQYLMHRSIKTTEIYSAVADELTEKQNVIVSAGFNKLIAKSA